MGSSKPGRDIAAIGASTVIGQLAMLLFVVLLARNSGVEELGLYVSQIAAATMLVAIFDFGTNNKWMIQLSNGTLSPTQWARLAYSKLVIAGLFAAIASLVSAAFGSSYVSVFSIFFFLLLHQTLLVYLKVFDLNHWFALSAGIERLAALALFAIFLNPIFGGAQHFWIFLCIGTIISSVLSLLVIRSKGDKVACLVSWVVVQPWKGSSSFAVTSIAGALRTLDVVWVAIVLGPLYAGLYGAVSKWFQPVIQAATISANVTTPWIASGRSQSYQSFFKALIPMWLAFGATAVCFFFPQEIVIAVLGERFLNASNVLPILALLGILAAVSTILGNWVQAAGNPKSTAWLSFLQLAIQFGFGIYCSAVWGLVGFCWAGVLSQSVFALGAGLLLTKARKRELS